MAFATEVTIRMFFTSDECDIVRSTSFLVDQDKINKHDLNKIIEAERDKHLKELEGGPFTNLRKMTPDEVEAYRAAEKFSGPTG